MKDSTDDHGKALDLLEAVYGARALGPALVPSTPRPVIFEIEFSRTIVEDAVAGPRPSKLDLPIGTIQPRRHPLVPSRHQPNRIQTRVHRARRPPACSGRTRDRLAQGAGRIPGSAGSRSSSRRHMPAAAVSHPTLSISTFTRGTVDVAVVRTTTRSVRFATCVSGSSRYPAASTPG